MKKETKELIKWAMSLIADYRAQNMVEHSNFRKNTPAAQNSEIEIKNCKDFAKFLNTLPEIESHLCLGGYIQDKNGTPCCHGDKVRFKFIEKWYEENFKVKYTPILKKRIFDPIMEGVLKFCQETKKFYIQFGPNLDGYGYAWLDWSTDGEGCEWFEKVKK